MMWRLKQSLSELVPWVLVASLAWGGYSMYQRGAFRHGIPSLGQALSYLPYFGSRFSQYKHRRASYAYSPSHRPANRAYAPSHRPAKGKRGSHRGRHHVRRHRQHR